MTTIKQFVRRAPTPLLREHFERIGLAMPVGFDWSGDGSSIAKRVSDVLGDYDGDPLERFRLDVDRISHMADELGEAALYATTSDTTVLDAQSSRHARAYCSFLYRLPEFRRAEEARFADERRRGRNWDGFLYESGHAVRRDAESIRAFETAVSELFGTGQVEAEVCDRGRKRHNRPDASLVQVTLYIEDRPNDLRAFRDGRIAYTTHRPVHEAAVTYEPETGIIEVVAKERAHRPALVSLFAEHVLATNNPGGRIPIRQYRIEHLRRPHEFQTEPEHQIDRVDVKQMCLMPFEAQGERLTLELLRKSSGTIWDLARRRLHGGENALGSYIITRITLVVRFKAKVGAGRARALPIAISAGTGCNLKDCTEQERLIGEKYLRDWGILVDV